MVLPATYNIVFEAQELPQKLSKACKEMLTGYWRCEFPVAYQMNCAEPLYIALADGRIIFSGSQQISWNGLLEALQRYVPSLRGNQAKHSISVLEKTLVADQNLHEVMLPKLLVALCKLELVTPQELEQALRLKILSDFDTYLFDYSGQASFLPFPQLSIQFPTLGFELESLISEAQKRQTLWRKLRSQIPSMEGVPVLKSDAISHSNLSVAQKQRLGKLVLGNKTLHDIATTLAQDPLDIAKGFAKLIGEGLVTLKLPTSTAAPEIVIVDDSPIILKQFERLATNWGYQVKLSQNPKTAVKTMLGSNPAIIFLDINMPDITGFDLVKQIRRQPQLASIPLVILTAEKTFTNSWRAQWGGCRFLTKPLVPKDVPQFQVELRKLLEDLAPLHAPELI
jgi:CheY-like chemotaxis protein